MVRATVNLEETLHHDLKSLSGGFVILRRLSYGEKLHRRAMVSKMKISGETKSKDFSGEMQLIDEQATLFDFQKCIVDHNLEDENDQKLNLANIEHIKKLDPKVGEEIGEAIDELNNFELEDEAKN